MNPFSAYPGNEGSPRNRYGTAGQPFHRGEVVWHWGKPHVCGAISDGLSISICTTETKRIVWEDGIPAVGSMPAAIDDNFVHYRWIAPSAISNLEDYVFRMLGPPPIVKFFLMAAEAIFNNPNGGTEDMQVNEGLDALQRAELVPDDTYELKIVRVRDERPKDSQDPTGFQPSWSVASCEVLSADDPLNNIEQFIGRRLDYWLIGQGGKQGVKLICEHKVQNDPGGGWEDGIPANEHGERDTQNLVGVTFKARVGSYKAQKGGYKQRIRPITY